jgi:trans-aconitate methyltransferase
MRWDAKTYDAKHGFVTRYGEEVLDLLGDVAGQSVLDLGCGTGHLTHKLMRRGALPTGIDADPEMIRSARATYADLPFFLADAAEWQAETPFDAVFSNAALHWMPDLNAVFARCRSNVAVGGRFVFEMGARGNVARTTNALHRAIQAHGVTIIEEDAKNYLSVGQAATLLEANGFTVRAAWEFDRPTPLTGEEGLRGWWIQFQATVVGQVPEELRDRIFRDAEEGARPEIWRDGTWLADYKRLRVIAERTA